MAAGSNVNCTATASDSDHWTQGANSGDEADTIASYTWTATRDGSPVGSFPYGNTGASVTWTAPTTAGNVTITCTVNDPPGPHVPPGDTGTRDDSPGSKSVTVTVYQIGCVKIEATNDVDIYWPNPSDGEGTTSNVIWKANQATFESTGTIVETCTRKAVADIFSSQNYTLTFTLARYPSCSTNDTPTTEFAYGDPSSVSGWTPAFSVPCEASIAYVGYDAALTFKVGGAQVGTQTISGIEEFDIYGSYTCPQSEFTKSHLTDACNWGNGQSAENSIASQVCTGMAHGTIHSCICGTSFDNIWQHTKNGDDGQCCCWAQGMIYAMQVLGFNNYVRIFANHRPEYNTGCGLSGIGYCDTLTQGITKLAWDGCWNTFQSAACGNTGQSGSTCYSVQGPIINTYAYLRDHFSSWAWVHDVAQTQCPWQHSRTITYEYVNGVLQ